ncbi:MAG: flagellar M-ring protein FliF [Candidatus Desulforudis sp.]|nr:flagellar M-ring protein FliF [Desulforudis sp.]
MDGQAVLAGANTRWQALSTTHKVSLVILAIGVVLASYYLTQFIRQMNYATLFARLEPREAGAIVEQLDGIRVPYMLSDGGGTIRVPSNRVDEARIHLATAGALGVDGAGWELFDRSKLGITEFEQQVNYQRALQEELRRTIVQLDEVEAARVHLVLPEKSIFAEAQAPPSASIALKLRPGADLNQSQVRGVVALVAGSVEGLGPENVQLIDMRGRLLSGDSHQDPAVGVALTHLEIRRSYERELEQRLQQVLQRVVGPDRVVAMVTADLDFSHQQSVSSVPHGEPQVISEQTVREESEGTGTGGVPGTDANLPGPDVYPLAGGTQSEHYSREERITNYQVGTLQQTVVQPPGELRRLSTSVVVDGEVTAGRAEQIQNVVAAALGFDQERGDQIMVAPMAFDTTYQEQLEEELRQAEALAAERERQQLIYYAALAGGALILFVILVVVAVLVIRRSRAAAPQVEDVIPLTVPVEAASSLTEKQRDVRELTKQKPDEVAQILKVWLTEK